MDVHRGVTDLIDRRVDSQKPFFSSCRGFIATSSLVVIMLAPFKSSCLWYLNAFWRSCGEFWQNKWDKFIDFSGDDEFNLVVWYTTLVMFVVYWGFGAIYTLMDLTKKPQILRQYKIQPNTNEPVDTKRLRRVIGCVVFNQVFVGIPFVIFAFYAMQWRGMPDVKELPTFHRIVSEIGICILVEEFGFYYSHRLMHHRNIYKHFHKQHHEWTAPIAVTAIYAHPLEHLLSNIFPIFLGVLVCGSHLATCWIWFTMALMSTLNAHSGYHFPFFPSPEAHDFHHVKFNYNYGMLGLLDWFHGTNSLFKKLPQGERHKVSFSFVPINKQIPSKLS